MAFAAPWYLSNQLVHIIPYNTHLLLQNSGTGSIIGSSFTSTTALQFSVTGTGPITVSNFNSGDLLVTDSGSGSIYGYDSTARRFESKPDVCYWITYKIYEDEKWKKKWEKVGWKSEGYSPQLASEIRAKRVRDIRHDGSVKTPKEIRAEKRLHDRPMVEIKEAYFSSEKGLNLKGRKTDLNRWDKHLASWGQKRVSSLSQFDMERIRHDMKGKAVALSGRVSLEMVTKAAKAGIEIIAAVSAPSSFAVEAAEKFNITLCGFVRGKRLNIYTHPERIVM